VINNNLLFLSWQLLETSSSQDVVRITDVLPQPWNERVFERDQLLD